MDERGVALTEMVVYFATEDLTPTWPRSLSTNIAKEGSVAAPNSGGDVYFARGGPRYPLQLGVGRRVCLPIAVDKVLPEGHTGDPVGLHISDAVRVGVGVVRVTRAQAEAVPDCLSLPRRWEYHMGVLVTNRGKKLGFL